MTDTTLTVNAYSTCVEHARHHGPATVPIATIDVMIPVLGITGKAGEIASIVKKRMLKGEPAYMDNAEIHVELGNLLYYINDLAIKTGTTLDEIAMANIRRLAEKYKLT